MGEQDLDLDEQDFGLGEQDFALGEQDFALGEQDFALGEQRDFHGLGGRCAFGHDTMVPRCPGATLCGGRPVGQRSAICLTTGGAARGVIGFGLPGRSARGSGARAKASATSPCSERPPDAAAKPGVAGVVVETRTPGLGDGDLRCGVRHSELE